jgi:hypothetical protein
MVNPKKSPGHKFLPTLPDYMQAQHGFRPTQAFAAGMGKSFEYKFRLTRFAYL